VIPVLHRAQEKQAPAGIGVEIDAWADRTGPVLSHDPPHEDEMRYLSVWLRTDVACNGFRPFYAVNCKSDGLEIPIRDAFYRFGIPRDRWFAVDMSYPSQRVFEKSGLPFAERVSEEEPWRGRSHQIWLDRWAWRERGYQVAKYQKMGAVYVPTLDAAGRRIEVHAVSMELHVPDTTQHERREWWRWLFDEVRPTSVCTDYPDDCGRTWEDYR